MAVDAHAAVNAIFTSDMGMSTVWLSRFVTLRGTRRLLGSYNLCSMPIPTPQAPGAHALREALAQLDPDTLTPKEALASSPWETLLCRILVSGLPKDRERLLAHCGEHAARHAMQMPMPSTVSSRLSDGATCVFGSIVTGRTTRPVPHPAMTTTATRSRQPQTKPYCRL